MKLKYTISTAIIGSILAKTALQGLSECEEIQVQAALINMRYKTYSLNSRSYELAIISPVQKMRFPDFGDAGECVECLFSVK